MKGIDSYYYEQGGLCMREGSEYKKYVWADVLTIINGRNQSAVQSKNGEYPIYGSGGIMGRANDYLCPEQCTIIGRKGNINKPIFVEEKFWNVDTAFGLSSNADLLLPRYLFYFCVEYNFEKHNKAVTIPSLTKADLLKIKIDLPSIELQQSIVAELDEINNLLQLKKKELETFDKLAQSIFYEMFGDPVTNEKGWEMKKLREVCFRVTDGSHFSPTAIDNGLYPMLSVKDMNGRSFDYSNCKYIDEESYNILLKQGCKPLLNDVLVAKDGSYFKTAFVVKQEIEQAILSSIAIIRPNQFNIHPIFLQELLLQKSIKDVIDRSYVTGTAIKRVILKKLCILPIPLPPLNLQQQFAQCIKAIEQQKEQVKASINKLEALLASRMQYWFD